MSKELECLKRIDTKNYLTEREHRDFYSVVEQALKRLEAIEKGKNTDIIDNYMGFKNDNAKPSEAINFINALLNARLSDKHFINVANNETWLELANIKQALINAQKEHKALEIIKEKDVDIFMLRRFKTLEAYNNYAKENKMKELTEEEFELLKAVLE